MINKIKKIHKMKMNNFVLILAPVITESLGPFVEMGRTGRSGWVENWELKYNSTNYQAKRVVICLENSNNCDWRAFRLYHNYDFSFSNDLLPKYVPMFEIVIEIEIKSVNCFGLISWEVDSISHWYLKNKTQLEERPDSKTLKNVRDLIRFQPWRRL